MRKGREALNDISNRPLTKVAKVRGENQPKQNVPDKNKADQQYSIEIMRYLKGREKDFSVDSYMSKRSTFNSKTRATVVKWMKNLSENTFKAPKEACFLGVRIFDVVLSRRDVTEKRDIKSIAAVSLCIACKYEVEYKLDFHNQYM